MRITSERYYTAAWVLEEELGYTYDADGNRLTKTRNGVISTYSYAAGGRLVGVSTAGELEVRVTDNGGRETSLVVDGQQLSLTYDSDDRVTRVVDGSATTDFAFDAAGRRVGVTTAGGAKRFLTAPNLAGYESPQAVIDATGSVLANYVHAGELPIAKTTSAGTEYYLTDANGSVIATASSSGAVLSSVDYDAFGNELDGGAVSTATHGDFRLHGMWKDPSGLYYVRARVYDSETGRFTTRDPVNGSARRPETLTPYVFAASNPHIFMDPTGRMSIGAYVGAVTSIMSNLASALSGVSRLATILIRGVRAYSQLARAANVGAQGARALIQAIPLLGAAAALDPLEYLTSQARIWSGTSVTHGLAKELGIGRNCLREAIHKLKDASGLGGRDNIEIDLDTGTVIDPGTGEPIGNIYDEAAECTDDD